MGKKKLGIIGGMGSHAAIWIFQKIINLSTANNDQDYLEIIIHNNTAIPDRTRAIIYGEPSPVEELERSIRIFNDNKIDVAIMACMTAHFYYDHLVDVFDGKIIHPMDVIVDELLNNALYAGKKNIGLIGSTGVIKSRAFHNRLEALGFKIITLNDAEQEEYFMRPLYSDKGIKTGFIGDDIKKVFLQQEHILTQYGADLIIGGCSEVPLIMNTCSTVPFINTFQLLAEKVVEYCYNEN